jgi:hypothetical protein
MAHSEQGFMQVGKFRLHGPLLIENILMKLKLMLNNVCPARTKARLCMLKVSWQAQLA